MIMKRIVCFILLNTFFSYSQSINQEKFFYSCAIKNYCDLLQKYIDQDIININTLENVHFVYKDIPKKHLPDEIENFRIKYIDLNDIESIKIINEKVGTVYIAPIKIENNNIILTMYLTSITIKDNKYNFANGNFVDVTFNYSCNENKWIVVQKTE